eukprot:TRINITY_DN1492_c0_g1_i1.p1 TRINITY_DN1492_c0_g1~~TRINITY_DN1492_c0_g1_i1.p1  ORF type:complete len:527 (+),score=196.18 TRINITY_DN1492_c0_g1_i1:56-1582(+)
MQSSYAPSRRRVVSAGALVREDADVRSGVVAELPHGSLVEVAESRGRRCRIVSPVPGWVSSVAADGAVVLQDDHGAGPYPTVGSSPRLASRAPPSPPGTPRGRRKQPPSSPRLSSASPSRRAPSPLTPTGRRKGFPSPWKQPAGSLYNAPPPPPPPPPPLRQPPRSMYSVAADDAVSPPHHRHSAVPQPGGSCGVVQGADVTTGDKVHAAVDITVDGQLHVRSGTNGNVVGPATSGNPRKVAVSFAGGQTGLVYNVPCSSLGLGDSAGKGDVISVRAPASSTWAPPPAAWRRVPAPSQPPPPPEVGAGCSAEVRRRVSRLLAGDAGASRAFEALSADYLAAKLDDDRYLTAVRAVLGPAFDELFPELCEGVTVIPSTYPLADTSLWQQPQTPQPVAQPPPPQPYLKHRHHDVSPAAPEPAPQQPLPDPERRMQVALEWLRQWRPELHADFQRQSAMFLTGGLDPISYHAALRDAFGDECAEAMVPHLASLSPRSAARSAALSERRYLG